MSRPHDWSMAHFPDGKEHTPEEKANHATCGSSGAVAGW